MCENRGIKGMCGYVYTYDLFRSSGGPSLCERLENVCENREFQGMCVYVYKQVYYLSRSTGRPLLYEGLEHVCENTGIEGKCVYVYDLFQSTGGTLLCEGLRECV